MSIIGKISFSSMLTIIAAPAFASEPVDVSSLDDETTIEEVVAGYQMAFDGADTNNGNNNVNDDLSTEARARVKEICSKVNATPEQKAQAMDLVFQYKIAAAPIWADARVAKLKYIQNALNPEGSEDIAMTSGSDRVAAFEKLLQGREKLQTGILFSVLQQDQRKAGLACMKAIRKAKHERRCDRD